jgi:Ca2+-binding RTX toxin-like protein
MAIITGNGFANTLRGTRGNDVLRGLGGNDTLFGLAGRDLLDGGSGNDTMRGGTGSDTYLVGSGGDVVIENPGQGTDRIISSGSRTLGANIENLTLIGGAAISGTGNTLNNVIVGNNAANTLRGLDGNDVLRGLGGNDRLEGGNGNDFLDGGTGGDTMIGGAGNDTFVVTSGSDSVSEEAGGGNDTVRSVFTFALVAPNLENLTLIGTANIDGFGNGDSNVLFGNSGRNVLRGFGGIDTLLGGAGNDTLDGGSGDDLMSGNAGNDVYKVDSAGDIVSEGLGAGGIDRIETALTFDLNTTPQIENLTLLGALDRSGGGNGLANVIIGNDGSNTLAGRAGNDTLIGGLGNDILVGGPGNDVLISGRGQDNLDGEAGADTYRYLRVSDSSATPVGSLDGLAFSQADHDKVDLRAIDANTSNGTGNDAFRFIGTAAFSGVAGQLRYWQFNAFVDLTGVEGDVDGDGRADFSLVMRDFVDLVAGDFIL